MDVTGVTNCSRKMVVGRGCSLFAVLSFAVSSSSSASGIAAEAAKRVTGWCSEQRCPPEIRVDVGAYGN